MANELNIIGVYKIGDSNMHKSVSKKLSKSIQLAYKNNKTTLKKVVLIVSIPYY
jgi:hypothetical protein